MSAFEEVEEKFWQRYKAAGSEGHYRRGDLAMMWNYALDHAAAVAIEFKLNEPSTPTERIYNVACDDFASAILREKEE